MESSLYLGHLGKIYEAKEEANQAQELDPLSPRVYCGASEEYLFTRDYDRAIEAAEKALEVNPNFGGGTTTGPMVTSRKKCMTVQ